MHSRRKKIDVTPSRKFIGPYTLRCRTADKTFWVKCLCSWQACSLSGRTTESNRECEGHCSVLYLLSRVYWIMGKPQTERQILVFAGLVRATMLHIAEPGKKEWWGRSDCMSEGSTLRTSEPSVSSIFDRGCHNAPKHHWLNWPVLTH